MKLKLPKELTTVTRTSKILAFVVFITLPFLGFFIGINYQQSLNSASQTSNTEPILVKRTTTPTSSPTTNTSTWKTFSYDSSKGELFPRINPPTPPQPIIRYSIKYPSDWSSSTITDTNADFGQVDFRSPDGQSLIHVSIEIIRPNGFTLDDIISNDKAFLRNITQKDVKLLAGSAIKVSGIMNENNKPDVIGKSWQVIYLNHGNNIARIFLLQSSNENNSNLFSQILQTFKFTN